MTDRRVAFIGAGRMGAAMIRRIADAGFSMTVYNRTRAKAEALGSAKVTVADTARVAVEAADVVPGVEQARQAHRQRHALVPAHRVPGGAVVGGLS